MLKIKVKHKIGDIVEHIFNSNKYKVIGYFYVLDCLKYVCLQAEKDERVYLLDCEIKSSKEYSIGFYL